MAVEQFPQNWSLCIQFHEIAKMLEALKPDNKGKYMCDQHELKGDHVLTSSTSMFSTTQASSSPHRGSTSHETPSCREGRIFGHGQNLHFFSSPGFYPVFQTKRPWRAIYEKLLFCSN